MRAVRRAPLSRARSNQFLGRQKRCLCDLEHERGRVDSQAVDDVFDLTDKIGHQESDSREVDACPRRRLSRGDSLQLYELVNRDVGDEATDLVT